MPETEWWCADCNIDVTNGVCSGCGKTAEEYEEDEKSVRNTWWCTSCSVVAKKRERCVHCGKTSRDKS